MPEKIGSRILRLPGYGVYATHLLEAPRREWRAVGIGEDECIVGFVIFGVEVARGHVELAINSPPSARMQIWLSFLCTSMAIWSMTGLSSLRP